MVPTTFGCRGTGSFPQLAGGGAPYEATRAACSAFALAIASGLGPEHKNCSHERMFQATPTPTSVGNRAPIEQPTTHLVRVESPRRVEAFGGGAAIATGYIGGGVTPGPAYR